MIESKFLNFSVKTVVVIINQYLLFVSFIAIIIASANMKPDVTHSNA